MNVKILTNPPYPLNILFTLYTLCILNTHSFPIKLREVESIAIAAMNNQPAVFSKENLRAMFHIHETLGIATRQHYGFHEMLHLKMLESRKNVQIALLSNSLKDWELISRERYGHSLTLEQNREMLTDIIVEYFVPKIEAVYKTKIDHYYLLQPHIQDNIIYTFSIKLFASPLFKGVDAHQIQTEERFANCISRYIRQVNGRGPERISCSIIANRFLVVCIAGLLSPFGKQYLNQDPTAYNAMQSMLTTLVEEGLDTLCSEEYQLKPEKFIEFDFKHNQIIALAILDDLKIDELI